MTVNNESRGMGAERVMVNFSQLQSELQVSGQ